jgi:hypothetical protein
MTTTNHTASERIPVWAWPVAVFAALLFVNSVPHVLAGPLILNLPTPFSGGPGTLSSPMVNVLWGLSNIGIGCWLLTRIRPWLAMPAVRRAMAAVAVLFVIFLTWAIGSLPLTGRFI